MNKEEVLIILEGCVVGFSFYLVLYCSLLPVNQLTTVFLIAQYSIIIYQNWMIKTTDSSIYRVGADNSILCCVLVPMAVIADYGTLKTNSTEIEDEQQVCSSLKKDVYFTIITSLLSWYSDKNESSKTWYLRIVFQLSGVFMFMKYFDCTELLLVCFVLVIFYYMNKKIPYILPRSFTYGELYTVNQLLMLAVWRILHSAISTASLVSFSEVDCFCSVGIMGLALAIIISYLCDTSRRPILFYVIYIGITLVFLIPLLYIYLEEFPITWLIKTIFKSYIRVLLLCYWIVCSVVAGCIVGYTDIAGDNKTNFIVIRKYFHLVVVIVYLPGLVVDVEFLYLSSVFALAFLVILETIRVCNVPPFGNLIDQSFCLFTDERDQGVLILTHLYLLIGLSLPLWISKTPQHNINIKLYSGVLALGVGDTVASIVGSSIGRLKWPGSKKTVEGTVSSVVSQFLIMYLLYLTGCIHVVSPWKIVPAPVLAVILTSLYEAFTLQIDNLVLPILMFALLSI